MLQQPCQHLVIDIETANAEPTAAEAWARRFWSPSGTWKPLTIGERYLEAVAKKKEKLALIDAAPIVAVAIKTEQHLLCLHSMRQHEALQLPAGGYVLGLKDEREMLAYVRLLLEQGCDPDTTIIGHNIKRFDLPKLRHRFVLNGLRPPGPLLNRDQPLFDTMSEYSRFSMHETPFISAADLAEELGVQCHKGILDGSEIPELYAAGRYEEIVTYCLLDVCMEWDLFSRMTGQAGDQVLADRVEAAAATPQAAETITIQPSPSPSIGAAVPQLKLEF